MNREEWLAQRRGRFTASKIADIMGLKQDFTKSSKVAQNYVISRLSELMTGENEVSFTNQAMQWGIDNEPYAAEAISNIVDGFEYMGGDDYTFWEYNRDSGSSPDGMIFDKNTIVEIKCPFNTGNHLIALSMLREKADLKSYNKNYYYQVIFNIMCFAKQKKVNPLECMGMFCSFDPRIENEDKRLAIIYLKPDEKDIEDVDSALSLASRHIKWIIEKIYGNGL